MAKLVNWYEFNRKLKDKMVLLFSADDIRRLFGVSRVAAGFLVHRYAAKGYIARVKRGLYVFPDALPPEFYLANKIYEPSYVSREFALSYHRVIPETVYEVTSVTVKATRRFEKLGKIYSYRRIKKPAFAGYTTEKQKGFSFQIADPEKAFVDTNYFRMLDGLKPLSRFDKEKLNPSKALRYASLFGNGKLASIMKTTLK
ncbi:MAG: type IV toxin-antitoxin system AbiEi family antitoxin domain-containing protein [Candidatus Doudnabacteria bacterium]|nr:type IV toxin-antitoxin system AbiEi family antitoxin domain-containing protein [Candidatus Doudnabacteria bacterium]